jgi:hypothetical protein
MNLAWRTSNAPREEREIYIYINNIEVTEMVAGGGAMVAVVKVAG